MFGSPLKVKFVAGTVKAPIAVNPNEREAPGLMFTFVATFDTIFRVAVEAPSVAFHMFEKPETGRSKATVHPEICVVPLFVMTMSALKPSAQVGVRKLNEMLTGAVCAPASINERAHVFTKTTRDFMDDKDGKLERIGYTAA